MLLVLIYIFWGKTHSPWFSRLERGFSNHQAASASPGSFPERRVQSTETDWIQNWGWAQLSVFTRWFCSLLVWELPARESCLEMWYIPPWFRIWLRLAMLIKKICWGEKISWGEGERKSLVSLMAWFSQSQNLSIYQENFNDGVQLAHWVGNFETASHFFHLAPASPHYRVWDSVINSFQVFQVFCNSHGHWRHVVFKSK